MNSILVHRLSQQVPFFFFYGRVLTQRPSKSDIKYYTFKPILNLSSCSLYVVNYKAVHKTQRNINKKERNRDRKREK